MRELHGQGAVSGQGGDPAIERETWAKNLLKAELQQKGITYAQLAEAPKGLDIHETERNLNNKISRGIQCGFLLEMLKRCWSIIAALGLALSLSVLANGQESEAGAGQGQPSQQQAPAENPPPPFRVEIVEDQAEAESRNRSEQSAEQRELNDLAAQQGMNEATQKMADYAVYQTVLVAIGTGLLFYTLWLTRQANRAAQAAVDETRRIGEAQVRAYVSWAGVKTSIGFGVDNSPLIFSMVAQIQNTGQSPAKLVALYSDLQILKADQLPVVRFDLAAASCNDEVGAGNHFNFMDQIIPMETAKSVYEGEVRCYLMGWGAYRDIFWKFGDPDRVIKFCFQIGFRMPPEVVTVEHAKAGSQIVDLQSRPKYTIEPRSA